MQAFDHPDFEMLGSLGAGGHAYVVRARHVPLDRTVAIKVLRNADDAELAERLVQEAQMVAKLKHPHLVQIYDVGTLEDGRPYIVMECVSGGTLTDYLRTHTVTPAEAVRIVRQVAGALGEAHAVGIVHRDIKLTNILMEEGPEPWAKLADFGVARPDDSEMTEVGTAMGTPSYMAPECFKGHVTPVADVYALGILLYELLVGRKPFKAKQPFEWMMHHAHTTPVLPASLELTPALRKLVLQMLAKAPEKRPADGRACEALLATIQDDPNPTLAVPIMVDTTGSVPTKVAMGLAAVGSASLVGVVGVVLVLAVAAGALAVTFLSPPQAVVSEQVEAQPNEPARVVAPAPEVVEPEVTGPEVVEPEVVEPEGLEPEGMEPEVVEPEVVEPEVAEPEVAEPEVAEPEVVEPEVVEPEVVEVDEPDGVAVAPEPEPPPEPAVVELPTGTYQTAIQGRPLTLVVSGNGSQLQVAASLKVGAGEERHVLVGAPRASASGWSLDLKEAGGTWGLNGELTRDGELIGNLTIKGKSRGAIQARR